MDDTRSAIRGTAPQRIHLVVEATPAANAATNHTALATGATVYATEE